MTFVTHTPLGKHRMITVDLNRVSCLDHRLSDRAFIPIRVKGKWLYYLLDKKGTFTNPSAFDRTVGLYRDL